MPGVKIDKSFTSISWCLVCYVNVTNLGVYGERSPGKEDWKYLGKKFVAGVANLVNCVWLSCGRAEQLFTLCHFLSLKKKNNCSFFSTVLVLNLETPCENPTPNAAHTAHFRAKHCLFNILTVFPFQNFHFYFSSLYFLFSKKFLNRKLAYSPESSFSFLTP